MTASLAAYRTAVRTTLEADSRMAGVHIYEHGGDLDREEVKRYAQQTPAVVVSLISASVTTAYAGVPSCDVLMSAVVFAQDKPGLRKDVGSMTVAHSLLNILARHPRQTFGLCDIKAPHDIKALNLYDKKIDEAGVSLWAVSWVQCIVLDPTALVTDTLDTLGVTYDLAPRFDGEDVGVIPEAEDEIDLTS